MRLKPFLSRLMALLLVVTMGLMGCSSANSTTGLTGNYGQDTQTLLSSVNTNIELANDAPERIESVNQLREQINDYTSRYRRNSKVAGLRSFTTMQTALNSLAGYYSAYSSRPLSAKLEKRLRQEFKQVEIALKRGR